MRRVLKKIANNERELGDISTMADSSVVEVIIFKKSIDTDMIIVCFLIRFYSTREKR